MKLRALAPILLVLVSVAPVRAIGADSNAQAAGSGAMTAPAAVWANGMVMDIDRRAGKVTLIHGPINNIGLGPLTREFQVKDTAGFAKIKDGDRVRFQAEQVGANVIIVVIEIQKE
jgi:Cu/Ag efflux protein CusF